MSPIPWPVFFTVLAQAAIGAVALFALIFLVAFVGNRLAEWLDR